MPGYNRADKANPAAGLDFARGVDNHPDAHMNSALVETRQLSKAFRTYRQPRDRFLEWLSLGRVRRHELAWVLKDINLTVRPGECVGLIGPNGAGKSTLLRLLSKTLLPTSGSICVKGKAVSLLELGIGFNAELTGRQNILHTAQLSGFSAAFTSDRIGDMQAFADIGHHFDRPVRTYSSGMMLRVAFAMFAFLEPDVLIIDEALAVGDAAFQRKCHRHIEKMVNDANRAVVLVSHDLQSIIKLCTEVHWLDKGSIRLSGDPSHVVQEYLKAEFSKPAARDDAYQPQRQSHDARPIDGDEEFELGRLPEQGMLMRSAAAVVYPALGAELLGLWIEDANGNTLATVDVEQPFNICYGIRFSQDVDRPVFGIRINTIKGDCLVATNSQLCGISYPAVSAEDQFIVRWPMDAGLSVGDYFISCGCSVEEDMHRFLMREVDGYQFAVIGESRQRGLCHLNRQPVLARLSVSRSPVQASG